MPHQSYIGSDGKPWPSATELTHLLPQEWLWAWFKSSVKKSGWRGWQRCLAQSNRGRRIGTEVHSLIESYIKKAPITQLCESKYNSIAYADALFDKVNPIVTDWLLIEPHLVSEELKIHGTADAIALMKVGLDSTTPLAEAPVILDWKTSASKSNTHPIQLAIYALCYNETHAVKVDIGVIARIDKKSKKLGVKLDVYTKLKQYYPVVKALRVIWEYNQNEG